MVKIWISSSKVSHKAKQLLFMSSTASSRGPSSKAHNPNWKRALEFDGWASTARRKCSCLKQCREKPTEMWKATEPKVLKIKKKTMKSNWCKSPAKARGSWRHLFVLSTWTSRLTTQVTSSNRICFKLRVFPPLWTTSTSDQHTVRPMNKGLNARFCRTGLGRKMSGLCAAKKTLHSRSANDQTT